MNVSANIDAMVRDGLTPFLKTFGFRRRGNSFARTFAYGFDVLGLQKSQWGNREATSFTVNLGVCWTRAQALLGRSVDKMPFTNSHCTVFGRIGCVMPEHRDFWWKIQWETPLDSVQLDLLERIDRYVIPWFDWAHDINNSLQLTREYKLIEYIAALEIVKKELNQ